MAKLNEGDKDMRTGRDAKDEQMRAVKKVQGTPVRQSELPPFISKDRLPGETED
jgi:hypothetical protein